MLFRQTLFVIFCYYSLQAIPRANPTDSTTIPRAFYSTINKQFFLAEKFVPIQFVSPFPRFDDSISQYLTEIAAKLQKLWICPKFGCNLKYSNITKSNSTNRWIYEETRDKHMRARSDLLRLKTELAELFPAMKPADRSRSKRGLPIIAAGLIDSAAAGFGLGSSCFSK